MHTGLQHQSPTPTLSPDAAARIVARASELGFQEVGIADADLSAAEAGLLAWLAAC